MAEERRKLTHKEMVVLMRDPTFLKWAMEKEKEADEAVRSGKYKGQTLQLVKAQNG
jgi:hypothetical protein